MVRWELVMKKGSRRLVREEIMALSKKLFLRVWNTEL